VRLVAIAVVLAAFAPAALAGSTPGVTASTITIGGTVPITGPAACSAPSAAAQTPTSNTSTRTAASTGGRSSTSTSTTATSRPAP